MKKFKTGELATKVIRYAIDKATTREPWFCRHEVADFLGIEEARASEVLSRLQRNGFYGKTVLVKLGNKSNCKLKKNLHTLYQSAGAQHETPKGEATIPVDNETVKRLGQMLKEGESYDSAINRLFVRVKGLNQEKDSNALTISRLSKDIKNQAEVLSEYRKKLESRPDAVPLHKYARQINDMATQMSTLVKEYGKAKVAIKKQKDINKILIQYLE